MTEEQIKQFPTSAEEYFHKQEKYGIPWKTEVYQFFEVIKYYRKATKELQEQLTKAKEIISKYYMFYEPRSNVLSLAEKYVKEEAEVFLNDKYPFTKEECCIYGTVQQCKKCDKETKEK